MANINKIRLSGQTYDIQDQNASKTVELTQAQYDALTVKDPNTFYVITDAQGADLSNYYTKSETSGATQISTALGNKQDTLVSGTNIKTINNENILGSGNINIQGGGKAVTGGTNISVVSGETADTINCTLNISNGTGGLSIKSLGATSASANHAAAFGQNTNATKVCAFAEGWGTTASGAKSHSEGDQTNAKGGQSHAEGSLTYAIADYSHSEGYASSATSRVTTMVGITTPYGWNTRHSEGYTTIADNGCTHTEGLSTKALNVAEHSSGAYNVSYTASTTWGDSGNTLFSVGNGTADNARHNAFEIRQNGDIYLTKDGQDVKLQDQLGGSSITVDTALDSGSTNAVANSAITIAIDELSASSVTNCDNVVIEDAIPTPPSTIVDENVKVSWADDYTETYAVDYEGNIGDGVEHVGYNVSKLEFGSFSTEISYDFRFSADECYSDLKTVIFNGNVNFGEANAPFSSAFNIEAVYFYALNPSAITCDNFDDGFLYVYDGCETYETSAATYPIYVADLAAYSGATLYNDGNNDVTWGQHFGNRLQEIPKGKKLVLTDVEDRLAEDEEVTAAGLNALNDAFGGLKLMKISQTDYDNLQVKDQNTLYIIVN